ncbi:MAG: nucleotidyltransferase domain-containing protein [Methylacidiphilaceae bacterium]|nr:nucleotidyltransferase domain-containing protein [Candidatus Methylacidiphilaceae bacterium]
MSGEEKKPPIAVSPVEWETIRTLLRRYVPECEVWAFGSRTRGKQRAYSDLDLVILGQGPMGIARLAELAEAFSASDLPWKVDLLDWAEASESFRAILEQERVVLQEKGKSTLRTP